MIIKLCITKGRKVKGAVHQKFESEEKGLLN